SSASRSRASSASAPRSEFSKAGSSGTSDSIRRRGRRRNADVLLGQLEQRRAHEEQVLLLFVQPLLELLLRIRVAELVRDLHEQGVVELHSGALERKPLGEQVDDLRGVLRGQLFHAPSLRTGCESGCAGRAQVGRASPGRPRRVNQTAV